MTRRLLRGIGGNVYGQAVTVVVQLAAIPGFVHAWGGARFGTWLLLSALSSLLTMADCGITLTSGTAMTMAVARRDVARAGQLWAQAGRFVGWVSVGLGLALVVASVAMLQFDTHPWSDRSAGSAGIALCVAAFVALHLGNVEVAFRANGDYPLGLVTTSTIRLAETLAALLAATRGGDLATAAAALLAVRAGGLVCATVLLRHRAPWVKLRPASLRWGDMRGLVAPALAALAVPAGLALTLPGMTVVAGLVVPTAGVSLLVASRTLSRTLVQVLGLFNNAVMPEMAMAAGRQDLTRGADLIRLNLVLALGTLLPGWVALVLFGPTLMRWWTGGALVPDPAFFALMATGALCHGAWLSASNLLLAVNRQADYAYRFLTIACVACLGAMPLGHLFGLDGVAIAALAGEVAMVAVVLPPQIRLALRRGAAAEGMAL